MVSMSQSYQGSEAFRTNCITCMHTTVLGKIVLRGDWKLSVVLSVEVHAREARIQQMKTHGNEWAQNNVSTASPSSLFYFPTHVHQWFQEFFSLAFTVACIIHQWKWVGQVNILLQKLRHSIYSISDSVIPSKGSLSQDLLMSSLEYI